MHSYTAFSSAFCSPQDQSRAVHYSTDTSRIRELTKGQKRQTFNSEVFKQSHPSSPSKLLTSSMKSISATSHVNAGTRLIIAIIYALSISQTIAALPIIDYGKSEKQCEPQNPDDHSFDYLHVNPPSEATFATVKTTIFRAQDNYVPAPPTQSTGFIPLHEDSQGLIYNNAEETAQIHGSIGGAGKKQERRDDRVAQQSTRDATTLEAELLLQCSLWDDCCKPQGQADRWFRPLSTSDFLHYYLQTAQGVTAECPWGKDFCSPNLVAHHNKLQAWEQSPGYTEAAGQSDTKKATSPGK